MQDKYKIQILLKKGRKNKKKHNRMLTNLFHLD